MVPMTLLVASVLGAGAGLEDGVLDFTAPWCGPCQQLSPMVSRLERQGFPIRKVDCDSNRDLVNKFNVRQIPAFILVIDGEERARLGGGVSEDELKRFCARVPKKNAATPAAGVADAVGESGGVAAATAPKSSPAAKSSPEKSSGRFPFLAVKRDNSPARDLREGAVPRAKAEDRTKESVSLQGSPLDVSVRLRVKDDRQPDAIGSGTIIDSRVGKSIILTCGHIFRNRDKNAIIEVECFCGGREVTIIGRRFFHDDKSDVGLITINVDSLPSCRVAFDGTKIVKGAPVISVGCSEGDKPTVQRLKITALNRYQGADNIEVAGMPVEGRSGGGLFTQEGQLIGVCSGADSHYREGFFAGLQSVHDILDRCHLTHLYDPKSAGDSQKASAVAELAAGGDGESFATADNDDVSLGHAAPGKPAARLSQAKAQTKTRPTEIADARGNAGDERSIREALEQAGEAEIVCIIRPINQPGAGTRVVIMNRASRRFVEYLSDEMDDRPEIRETTLKADEQQPSRRKPVARQPGTTQKVKRPATNATGDAAAADEAVATPAGPKAYRRKPANRPAGE
jgi:thiol-disulfide isomerase/thioredoxin